MSDGNSKREENEIVVALLRSCVDKDVDKLTIMSKAFVSDAEATFYLARLVRDGLLEYTAGLKRYKITTEGMMLLNHFK